MSIGSTGQVVEMLLEAPRANGGARASLDLQTPCLYLRACLHCASALHKDCLTCTHTDGMAPEIEILGGEEMQSQRIKIIAVGEASIRADLCFC